MWWDVTALPWDPACPNWWSPAATMLLNNPFCWFWFPPKSPATKCLGPNTVAPSWQLAQTKGIVVDCCLCLSSFLYSSSYHLFLCGPTPRSSMWSSGNVYHSALHTHGLQVSPWWKLGWADSVSRKFAPCIEEHIVGRKLLFQWYCLKETIYEILTVVLELLCFLSFLALGGSTFLLWLRYPESVFIA